MSTLENALAQVDELRAALERERERSTAYAAELERCGKELERRQHHIRELETAAQWEPVEEGYTYTDKRDHTLFNLIVAMRRVAGDTWQEPAIKETDYVEWQRETRHINAGVLRDGSLSVTTSGGGRWQPNTWHGDPTNDAEKLKDIWRWFVTEVTP